MNQTKLGKVGSCGLLGRTSEQVLVDRMDGCWTGILDPKYLIKFCIAAKNRLCQRPRTPTLEEASDA